MWVGILLGPCLSHDTNISKGKSINIFAILGLSSLCFSKTSKTDPVWRPTSLCSQLQSLQVVWERIAHGSARLVKLFVSDLDRSEPQTDHSLSSQRKTAGRFKRSSFNTSRNAAKLGDSKWKPWIWQSVSNQAETLKLSTFSPISIWPCYQAKPVSLWLWKLLESSHSKFISILVDSLGPNRPTFDSSSSHTKPNPPTKTMKNLSNEKSPSYFIPHHPKQNNIDQTIPLPRASAVLRGLPPLCARSGPSLSPRWAKATKTKLPAAKGERLETSKRLNQRSVDGRWTKEWLIHGF